MKPLGLSQSALAQALGVRPMRISQIVRARRAVTADTALRRSRYFGTRPGWWLDLPTLARREAPSCGPREHAFRARRVNAHLNGRYILLKKYEGFVTSRSGHGFTARLYENITDYPVLEAEFDLEELSETDRELAVEGASMVWTIGYNYDGSIRERESAMYFRRLPPWAGKEMGQARQHAEELIRAIPWE
jgi:addiction module HigA family antidote